MRASGVPLGGPAAGRLDIKITVIFASGSKEVKRATVGVSNSM